MPKNSCTFLENNNGLDIWEMQYLKGIKLSKAVVDLVILGDPEVTANIYCKSRNLPNTDTENYSTDLR